MGNPDRAFGLAVGDRVECLHMGPDPMPIWPGTQGTVTGFCDSQGLEQVWVRWDDGRSLNLIPGVDEWRQL